MITLLSVDIFLLGNFSENTGSLFTSNWLLIVSVALRENKRRPVFQVLVQDPDLILRWFTFQCESSQIPNEALSKTTLIFRLYGWNRSRKRRRVRLDQDCCIHLCTTGACTNHVHTVRFTLNTACKPVSITIILTWSWPAFGQGNHQLLWKGITSPNKSLLKLKIIAKIYVQHHQAWIKTHDVSVACEIYCSKKVLFP